MYTLKLQAHCKCINLTYDAVMTPYGEKFLKVENFKMMGSKSIFGFIILKVFLDLALPMFK